MFKCCIWTIVLLMVDNLVLSQTEVEPQDTLMAYVTPGVFSSSKNFAPFYLVNNQYGEVDEDAPVFLKGSLHYSRSLVDDLRFSTGFSFRNDLFSSYYAGLDYHGWQLELGRVKRTYGGLHTDLSSGALAMSQNALPIPSIYFSLNEYKDIPLTHGYLKIKGSFMQGWLEEDRYISKPLLHGKSLHGMLDLSDEIGLQISSGIIDFAQYGGVSPLGDRLPSSFRDFLKVVMGKGIPSPLGGTAGEANGLGNHVGITEFTFRKQLGEHFLSLNFQKQFEDGGSMQFISFKDFLIGLEWDLPKDYTIIDKVLLEVLQSKWQSGKGFPDPTPDVQTREDNMGYEFGERDDYYNNYLYRSGWTYHGMVIGNPLFLTYQRTLNFFQPYPDYGVTIANNRIQAFHLGIEGHLSSKITYKWLLTYSKNYGTYAGIYEGRFNWGGIQTNPDFEYVFLPVKKEVYSMLEINLDSPFDMKPISFNGKFAYDYGDLYNNKGVELSVNYRFSKH